MTRKLVDVAQDVIVRDLDCGTENGITMTAIYDGEDEIASLSMRIYGRVTCDDIYNPTTRELIVAKNEIITDEAAKRIEKVGLEKVKVRSVLTCDLSKGCCAKCYGLNLATGQSVKVGEAVGIIAAQSIGEPGTQLTMRTFHIGGTANSAYRKPQIASRFDGVLRYENVRTVTNAKGEVVVVNKNGSAIIFNPEVADKKEREWREDARKTSEALGMPMKKDYDFRTDAIREAELERYELEPGSVLQLPDGAPIKTDEVFVSWVYNLSHLPYYCGMSQFLSNRIFHCEPKV